MENRSIKLDLIALGLLVLTVFLGVAFLTYDPADPVTAVVAPFDRIVPADILVYPQNATVQNACGKWGALAASVLLTGLGIGAYYLVISLAILDVMMLVRRNIEAPATRMIGWCISLFGLVSVCTLLAPAMSPGPVIGSGGYLGALGAGLMEWHFALPGGVLLSASLIVGGLLLCTDYVLIEMAIRIARGVIRAAVYGQPRARRQTSGTDTKDPRSKNSEVAIRVGGVVIDQDEELLEDEEEEAAEEAEDEDELEEELEDESEPAVREVTVRGKKKRVRADQPATEPRIRRKSKTDDRQAVMRRLDEASLSADPEDYRLPDIDLLIESDDICFETQAKEVRRKAKVLERTFANFGFNVKVVEIETGPVIAQYEVELEAGLRLSRITGLADDLAIALRVPSVRIVAPIPGKNTVGIEVPNETRQIVRLREVMEESQAKVNKMRIPLFLGKDVSGNSLVVDLSTLPHLLIAGRTGTGKSVCLNAIISSILMTRRPDEVRMLMIDPKMVELSCYGRLPHLMHPVVTDMRKAEAILAWAVEKMEERYSLLARSGVRHITSYNQLGKEELIERLQPETDEERDSIPDHLPFIVIVADEMADLMMTSGKEVEQHIIRLAQKSRAVGIHLILATQKPTVDVITGLIKSNLPARISFQVASRTDSRVVLDEMGAEKLLGNGDMLFLWPGTSMLLRGQGTYLSDDEINAVVGTVSTGEQNFVHELVNIKVKQDDDETAPGQLKKRDELYESAVDVIVREGRGSVSLLQRALGIGYGRAARLIDFMAEDSIVGQYNGSQAREVLISPADWERMQGIESDPEDAEPEPARPVAKPALSRVTNAAPARRPKPPPAVATKKRRNTIRLAATAHAGTPAGLGGSSAADDDHVPWDADDLDAEFDEDAITIGAHAAATSAAVHDEENEYDEEGEYDEEDAYEDDDEEAEEQYADDMDDEEEYEIDEADEDADDEEDGAYAFDDEGDDDVADGQYEEDDTEDEYDEDEYDEDEYDEDDAEGEYDYENEDEDEEDGVDDEEKDTEVSADTLLVVRRRRRAR